MLELITLIVRGVQFLFALIVLGLTGHLASYGNTPSEDSFLLFTAIWTLLVLVYLGLSPRFFPKFAHPYAILALDAVTMIFWFAGFIALAVWIGDVTDLLASLGYGCGGAGSTCSEAKAAAAFGAFNWLLFVFTTTMAALALFKGRGGKGTTTSEPAMVA